MTESDRTTTPEDGLTAVMLPPEKLQAVLDLLAELDSEEEDVTGSMMAGITNIATRPMAANQKHATGTGCLSSPTGWTCSDIDHQTGDG